MASVGRKVKSGSQPAISENTPQARRLMLVALLVVSASGLVFEISLTRLFSLFFQYHFTFLAVSLAVLGLSAGAASTHYIPTDRRQSAQQSVLVLIGLS